MRFVEVPAGARTLWVSGQIGTKPDGSIAPDCAGQCEQIMENIKAIQDARSKRIPDFIDPKLIREDIDIFERIQDEWAKSLGTLAAQVDRTHLQLSRAFIGPEERPLVGPPEPVVEKLDVPKISEERARRENKSAGEVISELARAALTGASERAGAKKVRHGFRPFRSRGGIVTNDLIDKLRGEDAY